MIGLLLLASVFGYLAWSLVCLELNYKRASSMGIPLVRLPIDPLNILFQVFESHVWNILDRLRVQGYLPKWTKYARRGWYFEDKATSVLKLGKIWALVTPVNIYVQVAEPEAINEVTSKRLDFPRPTKSYELLAVFGPCISNADGDNWARHRKVLAAPFNESIMTYVFSESLKQTQEMLSYWAKGEVKSVAKDTRTLSLNVLAATGFKKSFKFSGSEVAETTSELSYRDALQTILDNCVSLMIFRPKFLNSSWLPESWRHVGKAATAFKQYMVQMLEEEIESLNQGESGSGSLMTSLVRAGDNYVKGSVDKIMGTEGKTKGLSVDEIFGNIFVINFAGHDTTANTLAFNMMLLAANPEVQEWIAEEVVRVTESIEVEQWDYNALFLRLVRCRAVMLEILRLYPPIPALLKSSSPAPQPLHFRGRTIMVPPNIGVTNSILAVHTHPDNYSDPMSFKPSRWISTSPDQSVSLITPKKGTYLPWSDGPQNCPGLKFSQVEFVAVLACLMKAHRIRAVKLGGESDEELRKRIMLVVEDCDFQMLLRMRDPDRVQVRCEKVV
ncbi:cytochrome P450 [Zopfia rhizophila CBS 207.26]|uniref:Cytochrome P450 n=1 Tax=Zopfia rhizophila CBS 207.26 TaxID=1314779 RepID=A0A6A6EVF4_9PEZI|nr:cytochrome P450 [Zopfia rhizophila CBS 207.26]